MLPMASKVATHHFYVVASYHVAAAPHAFMPTSCGRRHLLLETHSRQAFTLALPYSKIRPITHCIVKGSSNYKSIVEG